ncbi:hypothetical protein FRX31_009512 [Thalictrum thalictroides]|uniref:Uncharacterized protein n=1 Tax=Thalictrum thalictroides TaxID=46969 RepID=A0A7J6WTZ7_THATH|nr:hypothetical protein FRX31_009512 [Thalictrum thalictroides]
MPMEMALRPPNKNGNLGCLELRFSKWVREKIKEGKELKKEKEWWKPGRKAANKAIARQRSMGRFAMIIGRVLVLGIHILLL